MHVNDKARGPLAQQLASTVAALCDEWTVVTGWNHPASDVMGDLAIDQERFAIDLSVADAAAHVESLRMGSTS